MSSTIYEQTHIVAYGLFVIACSVLEKVAAVEAFETVQAERGFAKPQAVFLNTAYLSLKESVILGLLSMMEGDRSNDARDRVNCSIGELLLLLKDDRYSDFRDFDRKQIIDSIVKIKGCVAYQKLKTLRNRFVAHNDLVSMFEATEFSLIETWQLKNLIMEICDVLDRSFQLCVGVSVKHKPYDILLAEYIESLSACASTPYSQ